MKIWKIASKDSHSIWILPNGEMADVGFMGHEEYLRRNYKKFGIADPEQENLTGEGYYLAFKKGAVRLTHFERFLSLEGEKSSIKKFATKIHEFGRKHNTERIFCYFDNGTYDYYTFEELYHL